VHLPENPMKSISQLMSVRRAQADTAQISGLINSFAWTWSGLGGSPLATIDAAEFSPHLRPLGAARARREFLSGGSHDFALGLALFLQRRGNAPELLVHVDRAPAEKIATIVRCDGETYDIGGHGSQARREEAWRKLAGLLAFSEGRADKPDPVAANAQPGIVATTETRSGTWETCKPTAEDLQACLFGAGSRITLSAAVTDEVIRQLTLASSPERLWRAVECDRIERAIGEFARLREPGTPWWRSAFLRESRVLFAAALQEALRPTARVVFLYRPAAEGSSAKGSFVHALVEAHGQVWDIGGSGALRRSESYFGEGESRRMFAYRPPAFHLVDAETADSPGASSVHRKLREIVAELRASLNGVGTRSREMEAA
jgi:hypothetical protein